MAKLDQLEEMKNLVFKMPTDIEKIYEFVDIVGMNKY